jgi:hypothetical protein
MFLKKSLLFSILILVLGQSYAQISDFESINFTRADNRAVLHEGRSLENLPVLAHDLTFNLDTEVEKLRAIYRWVCHNISGDIRQNNITSRKREKYRNDSIAYLKWNAEYKRIAFKTLLRRKKTMCTGYAYLIKELCFLANIEAVIVDGYGRTVASNVEALDMTNHSWNAVKLNDKWYLCDATWSSGYMVNDALFINDYNAGYFLAEPKLFAKNHYPIQEKWLLNATLSASEFVESPLIYGATFEHQIIPVSPTRLTTKAILDTEVHFSFKILEQVDGESIQLVQYSGSREKALEIDGFNYENGTVRFTSKFRHKGTYDVHLKIGSDVVASYIMRVDKI